MEKIFRRIEKTNEEVIDAYMLDFSNVLDKRITEIFDHLQKSKIKLLDRLKEQLNKEMFNFLGMKDLTMSAINEFNCISLDSGIKLKKYKDALDSNLS